MAKTQEIEVKFTADDVTLVHIKLSASDKLNASDMAQAIERAYNENLMHQYGITEC